MTPAARSSDPPRARGAERPYGRLVVLTGEPGSGKTHRCREVVTAARAAGVVVRGAVTVDERGDAGVERWLEDLRGGERMLLGRMASPQAIASGGPRWLLSEAALDWCNAFLSEACPADLLIVDEVGPVELIHKRGALAGVRCALAGPYGVAVVVVRPWLVPRFQELFPYPPAEVVDVGEADDLAETIVAAAAGAMA